MIAGSLLEGFGCGSAIVVGDAGAGAGAGLVLAGGFPPKALLMMLPIAGEPAAGVTGSTGLGDGAAFVGFCPVPGSAAAGGAEAGFGGLGVAGAGAGAGAGEGLGSTGLFLPGSDTGVGGASGTIAVAVEGANIVGELPGPAGVVSGSGGAAVVDAPPLGEGTSWLCAFRAFGGSNRGQKLVVQLVHSEASDNISVGNPIHGLQGSQSSVMTVPVGAHSRVMVAMAVMRSELGKKSTGKVSFEVRFVGGHDV